MAKLKREELKAGDITDVAKETTGLVKEIYLARLKLTISLWEKNVREKALSNQVDKWFVLQGDYINLMRDLSEKSPIQGMKMLSEGLKSLIDQTNWLISLQMDYLELVGGGMYADKSTKNMTNS